jgi:hypothetical protein
VTGEAGSGIAGAAGTGSAGSAGGEAGAGPVGTGVDGGVDAASSSRDFSTDRTTFFGATRCAQAKVQLCEDF